MYSGNSDNKMSNIDLFYKDIFDKVTCVKNSDLYTQLSLYDSYIDRHIDDNNQAQEVRNFLETWVGGSENIIVISGESGLGKTSLCQKAMCDFYKDGWLSGKVDNVFCFSLNPRDTEAFANGTFYLNKLLSWGDNRNDEDNILREQDCKNALIFFDGFDELCEWSLNANLEQFIDTEIEPFQERTGAYVVITTGIMRLNHSITERFTLSNGLTINTHKLLPLTVKQQLDLVKVYVNNVTFEKREKLNQYLAQYATYTKTGNVHGIMGIPLFLRLSIECLYIPQNNGRYMLVDDIIGSVLESYYKDVYDTSMISNILTSYEEYSIRVFSAEENPITLESIERNGYIHTPLVCNYPEEMETESGNKVMFIHRIIYKYFLGRWIFNRLRNYGNNNGIKQLSLRKIDSETLHYLSEFNNNHRDEIANSTYERIINEIRQSNGFIEGINNGALNSSLDNGSKKTLFENYIWNTFSILSNMGYPIRGDFLSSELFKSVDFSGVDLRGADLSYIDLSFAHFKNANLWGVNFLRSNLVGIDLSYSNIRDACLHGTLLKKAELNRVDFQNADLSDADLCDANLTKADLSDAFLDGSKCEGANIIQADLSNASLRDSDLKAANLTSSYLENSSLIAANLSLSNLKDADLTNASFKKARLDGADLSNVCLTKTNFEAASLNNIILIGVKKSNDVDVNNALGINANFYDSNFDNGLFRNMNFSGARFKNSSFQKTRFLNADLSFSDFTNANLSGSTFENVNLMNADFSEANLTSSTLKDVNTYWANFTNCDLRGIHMTDVDFSWAQDSGSMFMLAKVDSKVAEYLKKESVDLTRALLNDSTY